MEIEDARVEGAGKDVLTILYGAWTQGGGVVEEGVRKCKTKTGGREK